ARGLDGAAQKAKSPRARALHPPRRAEDSRRLAAVPQRTLDRLSTFGRQAQACPLAPRARIELGLAAGEGQPVHEHGGRDTRAAIRGDLAGRDLRQRLVPRGVTGPGNVPCDRIDRLDVSAVALGDGCIEHHELAEVPLQLGGPDPGCRAPSGSRRTDSALIDSSRRIAPKAKPSGAISSARSRDAADHGWAEADRALAAVAEALGYALLLRSLAQDRPFALAFRFLVHAASSAGWAVTGTASGVAAGGCMCGAPRCPCASVP